MTKLKYTLYALCIALIAIACSSDDDPSKGYGYLNIEVETVTLINPRTRTVPEGYKPKQLAVKVVNKTTGEEKQITDNYEQWKSSGSEIRLEPGDYTVLASSNGFEGLSSGFDCPYYAGSTDITIISEKSVTADITCTLANVKVSVNFSDSFKAAFTSAKVTNSSDQSGVDSQLFTMNETTGSAYFPVAALQSVVSVVNKAGVTHTATPYKVPQVKAREHHIFNYTVAESGSSSITVEVDGSETIYTFKFPVSTEPSTSLSIKSINPWSHFAYVNGEISAIESGKSLDPAYMKFEYSSDNTNWINTPAIVDGNGFKATLTNLTANTTYKCRMSYLNGSESYTSADLTFTTEQEVALYNGNLDEWYKNGKTWYACSESYYSGNGGSFWDSSNPGTTTGVGAVINVNPTEGESTVVHTAGGKSAKLKSQYCSTVGIGKFAAASLYTGKFKSLVGANGAKLTFGQPVAARPTQLRGWYKYNSGVIDYKGDNTPASANIEKGTTRDLCSIYIVLTTKQYEVDNTDMSTFPDWTTDEGVVAYGMLPDSQCGQVDDWSQFTIDLTYRDLTMKPQYIILVCSSSKYGDYFTGSTSSLLYLDDMELTYGTTPVE